MNARSILVGALSLMILPGAPSHLFAQNKKQADLPTATVTGEVKGVKQGVLLVADGDQQYYVRVAPDAKKVDVTGEGDVSLLGTGMYVRLLEVKWDKKGNIDGDIKKLELFTYDKEIAPIGADESMSLVAGKITSFSPRAGKISVSTGKLTVKGTVAKDASVNVGVRGIEWLRLARPGHSITVTGKVANAPPKAPRPLLAEEVELKVTKAFAGAEFDKPTTKKKDKEKAKEKEKE
jgi:hypothetical protein